ncbi:conserved hypothetical protein [Methanohalobium evestigatum Z-7303]|uniref:Uncharacterized protein n=1 Tax=Methanohalobium evestigatum (strain ATCC BAA-1072 / DSM 3721 / NBRC 107634 / OCM 161 / Z-7303) TaxID=644295 RepID=D7EBE2_METEZ|nr:hypothetical protein [Methanohalobium evestigatum]ADI74659.1 conserved hypothetical protein [Methanohalobium evestigatum Z-7303]
MSVETSDYSIDLTQPCVDDPSKYIAQSRFVKKISMDILCQILQQYLNFGSISQLSCSEKLGVARFDFMDKTIILYKSGKIDVRRTSGVEDARNTMKNVEDMISGSFSDTFSD